MAEISLDDWIELLADRSEVGAVGEYFHRDQCGELLKFLHKLKLTMAEKELKPCPFCGGKAEIGSEHNDRGAIYCIDCGAKIEFGGCGVELKLKAIEAWNRRAS